MPSLTTALPLLLVSAVSVEPPTVPAKGRHEAIVKLDEAAMVRISTDAPAGMACTIVDHLRGPFASSGRAGESACGLDLLLDSGVYKLRLSGAAKAKGKATVKAVPFEEIHKEPLQLVPMSEVRDELRSGQQASFWVRVEQRSFVTFHATGRTAGRLGVWRAGEWLESINATHNTVSVGEGQDLHDWWIEQVMEPGEYRFTLYGTDEHRWAKGKGPDFLHVALGFAQAPEGRTAAVTLPVTGFAAMQLPKDAIVATLSLAQAADTDTSLSIHALGDGGESQLANGSAEGSCTVAAKALIPECATSAGTSRHVLVVRGRPGTKVNVDWAPRANDQGLQSGTYALGGRVLFGFSPLRTGYFRVSTHDVPAEADSPPQGCILERSAIEKDLRGNAYTAWHEVARDDLRVSRQLPFRRSFNHNGNVTRILFRVEEAAKYRITTSGERGTRCEVWRGPSNGRTRVTPSDLTAGKCDLQLRLDQGAHELTLHGGTEGIEKVRLTTEGVLDGPDTANKSTCLLPEMQLHADRDRERSYRLVLTRSGQVAARGIFFEPLPVTLANPYPVTVEPGAKLSVPVVGGQAVIGRASGGAAMECSHGGAAVDGKSGRCDFGALPSGTRELSIRNPGTWPISVLLQRPSQPVSPLPARAISPMVMQLQRATLDVPTWLDFDRGQQHALLFEVAQPGLYHVTTQGLLATTCDIRTPVVAGLGADSAGGRARNCLVAQYLRPGRYLLNVRAADQSKGRAAVVVSKRPVKTIGLLTPDGQTFFRAEPGELIRQTLDIRRPRQYRVESTALGAKLQCRLDDGDGWPMVTVPTSCANTFYLRKAPYLWTQLPLTVESMRRTVLERVKAPALLKGNVAHKLDFNTPYTARLGADGKDEFLFELPVELDVRILLTNAMQGRIYRVDQGAAKPVEIIPAQEIPPPRAAAPQPEPEESYEDPIEEAPPSDESAESAEYEEAPPEPEPAQAEETYQPEPGEPYQPPQPDRSVPAGRLVHLPAGKYRIVAEHSREDVNIDYAVQIFTDTLIPGAAVESSVPAKLPLRIPAAGTLRLHTEGQADVRCRLFDANGALLFENSNHGDDWNCAIAEPISAGDYTVVLESETQVAGTTLVSASVLEVKEGGLLAHGASIALGRAVQSFAVPDTGEGVVHDFSLRSSSRIGCALEGPDGKLMLRRSDVKECAFLARLGRGAHRVRLWTLASDAKVSVSHWQRKIGAVSGGRIPVGAAGTATVSTAGRYKTGGGVHCLPDAARGVLPKCSPEVSLESGAHVFSSFGPSGEAQVPLEELVAPATTDEVTREPLSVRPFIQRERSKTSGLHLIDVRVPAGETNAPACEVKGGARELLEDRCVASSGALTEAELRWSLRSDEPVEGTVRRSFVPFPANTRPLNAGLQGLTWEGEAARFTLPGTSRAELVLPPATWAVLLDGKGAALDVCGPGEKLQRCVLGGGGGELVIAGGGERYVEANVTVLEAPERKVKLAGLFETIAADEGRVRFTVPAADMARVVEVEGAARCVTSLDDGWRLSGCRTILPANRAAELVVDHVEGPLRALTWETGKRDAALFPRAPLSPKPLGEGRAEQLNGPGVVRTFELPAEAAIQLRSTAGVCALSSADAAGGPGATLHSDGFGKGCAIDRVLPPGKYALSVRPFAGVPLAGTASWTKSSIIEIGEGVSDEAWVAPGGARFFRFHVKAPGKIGLGLRIGAETVSCSLFGKDHVALGDGCQQYVSVAPGSYLFRVRAPRASEPQRLRPVIFGLAGSSIDVPPEYLKDFFSRIGGEQ